MCVCFVYVCVFCSLCVLCVRMRACVCVCVCLHDDGYVCGSYSMIGLYIVLRTAKLVLVLSGYTIWCNPGLS